MASRATPYSADACSCSVNGLEISSGRGSDEFIRFEQQEQDYTYKAGIDGEGCFSQSNNRYTIATLTMMQTSAGNAVLSALVKAGNLVAGGSMGPFYFEDRLGNTKVISSAAVLLKMPDEVFGRESGEVTWEIGLHQPERIVGGH